MFIIDFFKWLFFPAKKETPREQRSRIKKEEKIRLRGKLFYRSFELDNERNDKEDEVKSSWKFGRRKRADRFIPFWPWGFYKITEKKKPRNWKWLKRLWNVGSVISSGNKTYVVARDGSIRRRSRTMSTRDRHRFEVACRKDRNRPGVLLPGGENNIRSAEEVEYLYQKMV